MGEPVQSDEERESVKGRAWGLAKPQSMAAKNLRDAGATGFLSRILSARGMLGHEFEEYENPKLRKEGRDLMRTEGYSMPDPVVMQDMEKGAARIADAIRSGERIGIWSDYDVDGAASLAVFVQALRMCGHDNFAFRIPDRITEGYGPNTPGLLAMQSDEGCNLICCLDAGIVAFEPLQAAADAGIEMVVIDHHNSAQDGSLPTGHAIINPNRLDDTSGLGHLCAAGVTFFFFVAVVRNLNVSGYFDGQDGRPEARPDLIQLLDLVALATVCDVMRLVGINRTFVRIGSKLLTKRKNLGIAALARVAGVEETDPIDEKTCGWILGPRVNAGGRVGASDSGARLLIAETPEEALERAEALHAINVERREMSDAVTEAAQAQLADMIPGRDRRLAFAVVEDAHEGVVGISAGKLKEAKDAPAIVVTRDHAGNLKGSARSVADVNIGHIIQDAAAAGLILGGGGHGMAGGLNLRSDQVEGFVAFANEEIAKTEYFKEGVRSEADVAVRINELSVSEITSLDQMRPFGNGNPLPKFLVTACRLEEIRVLKDAHFKLTFSSGATTVTGLLWGVAGTTVGDAIEALKGQVVDVLATAEINEFRGKKDPQLMVEDIRPATASAAAAFEAQPSEAAGLAGKAHEVVRLRDINLDYVDAGSRRKSLVTHARVRSVGNIKGKHLKVFFEDDGVEIVALRWNAVGGETEKALQSKIGMDVSLLGELEVNEFRDKKTLQIKLDGFETHEEALI